MPYSVTHPGHGHSLVHRNCRPTAAGPFSRSSGSPLWQCARNGLESTEGCDSHVDASTASSSSDSDSDRVLMRMTLANVIMNVRESPSFDSQVVGSLKYGEIVEFKAETVTDNGTTIITIITTLKSLSSQHSNHYHHYHHYYNSGVGPDANKPNPIKK